MLKRMLSVAIFTAVSLSVYGCDGSDSSSNSASGAQGQSQLAQQPGPSSSSSPPAGGGGVTSQIGSSCHGSDPNQICLGLKWVVYDDSSNAPTVDATTTGSDLQTINSIWSQCNIQFQIDDYAAINPSSYSLNYAPSSTNELDQIRQALNDDKTLLVVTTGTWTGSLGSGSANAWTNLPGDGIYGSIFEASVGDFGNIYAHELGHYLNLQHVSDTSDVMTPVIYSTSTKLTSDQCSTARAAVQSNWTAMVR